MKRRSPDAGRQRARRRGDAPADVVPLYAAGMLAAATMVVAAWMAPTSLLALDNLTSATSHCHTHPGDDERGETRG